MARKSSSKKTKTKVSEDNLEVNPVEISNSFVNKIVEPEVVSEDEKVTEKVLNNEESEVKNVEIKPKKGVGDLSSDELRLYKRTGIIPE